LKYFNYFSLKKGERMKKFLLALTLSLTATGAFAATIICCGATQGVSCNINASNCSGTFASDCGTSGGTWTNQPGTLGGYCTLNRIAPGTPIANMVKGSLQPGKVTPIQGGLQAAPSKLLLSK
jgi:hypothetical protein